ncbi:MAG: hypothetical protein H0T99_10645 [Geodermatophilaceae bacterium]|nr:hypothetical protein [Geodermatophilaceae bacterium]MDQ3476915.1 hypothetical protein [Actinomycetota bacterium]
MFIEQALEVFRFGDLVVVAVAQFAVEDLLQDSGVHSVEQILCFEHVFEYTRNPLPHNVFRE